MAQPPLPDVVETNQAYVFLTPDRAFKLLKPVELPFLDMRDPAVRARLTSGEYELNRSFSPSVYLGVAELVDGSDTPDTMLVMRRLDAADELHRVAPRDGEAIHRSARRIAAIHSDAVALHGDDAEPAGVEALRRNWQDNLDVVRRHTDVVASATDIDEVATLAGRFLDGRAELLAGREEAGWVRQGHGDLRCEHVFVEDDEIQLLDALAFSDAYRTADVLNDIAFLAMDLHRLVGADAARSLMESWAEFTNEHHPSSLAHFYVAYRAHVRCKVECLRHQAGIVGAAAVAREYHDLALHHLRIAQPRLILVGGGPGTGKSTISQGIARSLGAVWLRSDEVRKDLAGIGHDDHAFAEPGQGIYTPEMTERVHAELRRQAALLLGRGESVVVDATWSSAPTRAAMRTVAAAGFAELDELCCVLPPAIARERIARRAASLHNPSDATPELVDHVLATFAPWPEARPVDTNRPIAESLAGALDALARKPSEEMPPESRFFIDAPVTIRGGVLVMFHEGLAPVEGLEGTLAPSGATPAAGG